MTKAIFVCSKCDAQSSKWSGRCLSCGAWGTLGEETATPSDGAKRAAANSTKPGTVRAFAEAGMEKAATHPTGLPAIDGILGGGFVRGAVTLMAGEPGIGKSTLLAQTALRLAKNGEPVLYVTGEESPAQVRRRLERLDPTIPPKLLFLDDTDAETIASTINELKPALVIVDSIQTVRNAQVNGEAGSVSQVKASAAIITETAKRSAVPVILVGQVTKDGDVAGPRVLEHLVDTVLFLEGDNQHRYRLLRVLKHRFGPTDEIAVMSMSQQGLEIVEDPSQELLRDRPKNVPGSAVSCLLEGHRPMLLEVQALVSHAGYGTPVRRATGVDAARLGMLLAVLARHAGIHALEKDVYANAAGGISAREPSIDLALAAAIGSAVREQPIDSRTGFFGEVGLAGELRPVALPELRLKELARLGFTTAIVPKGQAKQAPKDLFVKEVATLREAFSAARLG